VTLKQALALARERLASVSDVEDPRLECEILLRHVLQIDRAQLFMNPDTEIEPAKMALFKQWVERRFQGEPTAYIIQCREFFGLNFYVDKRVLIPRPETELLVEEAILFCQDHLVGSIADIGTGSGVIAISFAILQGDPLQEIYATDISISALEVANLNCKKHGVSDRIKLLQGDLLEPLACPVDLLIANLPYVKKADFDQMPSAKYEPGLALDGGENGLDQIYRLFRQLEGKINPGGCVLLEIGLGQSKTVMESLRNLFPNALVQTKQDLAGIERVVELRV
jgi:release factor glutamine methyltransferase